jgi:hypothetical protein
MGHIGCQMDVTSGGADIKQTWRVYEAGGILAADLCFGQVYRVLYG